MTRNRTHPVAFVCHASEDKDRFVRDFAERLRQHGVEAWYDEWEIMPGDRLVERVFNDGLKNADACIVVLSENSVDKPWVREEMNAAFVKRIESDFRVIPIVLDACEVPECLKTTCWVKIRDLASYSSDTQRIVNAIYGHSEKPPLGPGPAHAAMMPLLAVPRLQKTDAIVLQTLCDESVREGRPIVTHLACLDPLIDAGITEEELRDSLTILEEEGHVELGPFTRGGYKDTGASHLRITNTAFDEFAKAKWPEYDAALAQLISGLVNHDWSTDEEVETSGAPKRLCDHLVRLLEDAGLIKVERTRGGYHIWERSPSLKRRLADS